MSPLCAAWGPVAQAGRGPPCRPRGPAQAPPGWPGRPHGPAAPARAPPSGQASLWRRRLGDCCVGQQDLQRCRAPVGAHVARGPQLPGAGGARAVGGAGAGGAAACMQRRPRGRRDLPCPCAAATHVARASLHGQQVHEHSLQDRVLGVLPRAGCTSVDRTVGSPLPLGSGSRSIGATGSRAAPAVTAAELPLHAGVACTRRQHLGALAPPHEAVNTRDCKWRLLHGLRTYTEIPGHSAWTKVPDKRRWGANAARGDGQGCRLVALRPAEQQLHSKCYVCCRTALLQVCQKGFNPSLTRKTRR